MHRQRRIRQALEPGASTARCFRRLLLGKGELTALEGIHTTACEVLVLVPWVSPSGFRYDYGWHACGDLSGLRDGIEQAAGWPRADEQSAAPRGPRLSCVADFPYSSWLR